MIKYISTGNFWKPAEEPNKFVDRSGSRVNEFNLYIRVTEQRCISVTMKIQVIITSKHLQVNIKKTSLISSITKKIKLISNLFENQ